MFQSLERYFEYVKDVLSIYELQAFFSHGLAGIEHCVAFVSQEHAPQSSEMEMDQHVILAACHGLVVSPMMLHRFIASSWSAHKRSHHEAIAARPAALWPANRCALRAIATGT